MSPEQPRSDTVNKGARIAVAFPSRLEAPPHETTSQQALARKLAQLLKVEFVEHFQPQPLPEPGSVYYVPARTLVRNATQGGAAGGGYLESIRSYDDLYGGIVPHPFVATKAITHPVLHVDSPAPQGWSHTFSQETSAAVLRGITVFSVKDARLAGLRLLSLGPVRIKPVRASGGRGQILVFNPRQFDAELSEQDEREISEHGLVLEEHLADVKTYSVGLVRAGGIDISYVGTQMLVPNNEDQLVYGGSTLLCVRGDYEKLLTLPLAPELREAVRLARLYDAAAKRCYPELFCSRRNYDVAQGTDAQGRTKRGVLEQSWRAGGASYAEACALEVFQRSPELNVVTTYTRERYGADYRAPDDVQIIYQGDDSEVGFITKYAGVESYGHS